MVDHAKDGASRVSHNQDLRKKQLDTEAPARVLKIYLSATVGKSNGKSCGSHWTIRWTI